MQTEKPFWWPDARGFVIAVILLIVAVCVFYRMTNPSTTDDKVLDMMLTILFSTCLVAIVNFLFGSSRSSADKDETLNKIALAPADGPSVVVAWWSVLTDAERQAIAAAAETDAAVAAFIAAAKAGKATGEQLASLTAKGLLSAERVGEIKAA